MRSVVKGALESVVDDCLPGDHYFYISFLTDFNGVKMSDRLLKKYPQEMTILLDGKFQDLIVEGDRFNVTLFFNGVKETICVPYRALLRFNDPTANIELKFTFIQEEASEMLSNDSMADLKGKVMLEKPSNVISLAEFKKRRDK